MQRGGSRRQQTVTFAVYVKLGNTLDLSKIFATLQYFNFIQQPLMWFPRVLATLSTVIVAGGELSSPAAILHRPRRAVELTDRPSARVSFGQSNKDRL